MTAGNTCSVEFKKRSYHLNLLQISISNEYCMRRSGKILMLKYTRFSILKYLFLYLIDIYLPLFLSLIVFLFLSPSSLLFLPLFLSFFISLYLSLSPSLVYISLQTLLQHKISKEPEKYVFSREKRGLRDHQF